MHRTTVNIIIHRKTGGNERKIASQCSNWLTQSRLDVSKVELKDSAWPPRAGHHWSVNSASHIRVLLRLIQTSSSTISSTFISSRRAVSRSRLIVAGPVTTASKRSQLYVVQRRNRSLKAVSIPASVNLHCACHAGVNQCKTVLHAWMNMTEVKQRSDI